MARIIELPVIRQSSPQCTFQQADGTCGRTDVFRVASDSFVGQVMLYNQPPEMLQAATVLLNIPPSGQLPDGMCRWAGRGSVQELMCEGSDFDE